MMETTGSKTRIWAGSADTERGQEESASPHSWRVESTPLGKTGACAPGSGAHRTLLGSQFSKGILGGQSWVCFHLNTRAHAQCRRTRPCTPAPMCANEPRTQGQTLSQEARLGQKHLQATSVPSLRSCWAPGRTGRRPVRARSPALSPSPFSSPPSPLPAPQLISLRRGLQGHLREMASLSILGLRPSLLCVHSLSPGGPGSQRPGGLEPLRPASQGGVFPPS